ncbi:MAG: prephenate dehydratase [Anaerolineales bacterium]|nr:prephenate dehydratase [Anaerolineales bacterium]
MSIKTVGFQGEPGAYSEAAALEHFKEPIKTVPFHSFEKVFDAVRDGEIDLGMLPIENSLAGSIHRNYDLLMRYNLHIIGEYHFRVSHCLMALPGVKLVEIKRVYSHPQALAQCEASLDALGIERVVEYDTAGSARLLQINQDRSSGAIASSHAAKVYDLNILRDQMEDNPENYTRFQVLSTHPASVEEINGHEQKTSLAFCLKNEPGALYKALGLFASRQIDLTKLESRPLMGKPWEYLFYIDFVGQVEIEPFQKALSELKAMSTFLRVFGTYPRHRM